MKAKHLLLAAAASLSLGVARADFDVRSIPGWVSHAEAVFAEADAANLAIVAERASIGAWVAHADAVFAAADAENLARANASDERQAWVAHADAVFRAADEHHLALASALDSASSSRTALRLVKTSVDR